MKKKCHGKNCVHGDEQQPISNFYKSKITADGYSNMCKDCLKKITKDSQKKRKKDNDDFFNLIVGNSF